MNGFADFTFNNSFDDFADYGRKGKDKIVSNVQWLASEALTVRGRNFLFVRLERALGRLFVTVGAIFILMREDTMFAWLTILVIKVMLSFLSTTRGVGITVTSMFALCEYR